MAKISSQKLVKKIRSGQSDKMKHAIRQALAGILDDDLVIIDHVNFHGQAEVHSLQPDGTSSMIYATGYHTATLEISYSRDRK